VRLRFVAVRRDWCDVGKAASGGVRVEVLGMARDTQVPEQLVNTLAHRIHLVRYLRARRMLARHGGGRG